MPFPRIQGAFRERLVVNAMQCVKAEGLSAGEAAMAEPLSAALHSIRQAGEMLGRRVLVTGRGPIGAPAIIAARRAGAAKIVATDINANALAAARRVGADRVINLSAEPDALAAYTANEGCGHQGPDHLQRGLIAIRGWRGWRARPPGARRNVRPIPIS